MKYFDGQVLRPWLYRAGGLGVLLLGIGLVLLSAAAVTLFIVVGAALGLLAIGLSALTGRPVFSRRRTPPRTQASAGQVIEGEYHVLEVRPRGDKPRTGAPFHRYLD